MFRLLILYQIISMILVASAQSAETPLRNKNSLNLSLENDSRNIGGPGSDNSYTNGFRFSYSTIHSPIPKWAMESLMQASPLYNPENNYEKNYGLSFGQQMYTPTNIAESNLVKNDRPYAAWLYLGFILHAENLGFSHVLAFDIGTIGPQALGQDIQNGFHRVIGTGDGKGWKNQLKNEKTLQFFYQQRSDQLRKDKTKGQYFDLIPYYGYSFGNVNINAHLGCLLRLGSSLPNDFGPTRLSEHGGDSFLSTKPVKSGAAYNIYYFVGGRGILVFRDIFLDGNTFKTSPDVDKIPTLYEIEAGVVGEVSDWKVIWQFVSKSPEFREKQKYSSFASIAVSVLF